MAVKNPPNTAGLRNRPHVEFARYVMAAAVEGQPTQLALVELKRGGVTP
jgi:hypothetical protein